MAVLAIDCPHCPVRMSSFTLTSITACVKPNHCWAVFATCSSCHMPIALRMLNNTPNSIPNPNNYGGNIGAPNGPFQIMEIFPSQPVIDAPGSVPAGVEKAFKQAAESRRGGHYDAAAAMYRKAMEVALKGLSPEIEAWKIEKRIDKMAAEGLITNDLKDWAHELRLDGNDAVHEDEMTKEVIDQMHSLCTFLLTYLFTLPEQVKAARARRDAP
jgi:hypothetical protein